MTGTIVAVKFVWDTCSLQGFLIIIHVFRCWVLVFISKETSDRTFNLTRQVDGRRVTLSHGQLDPAAVKNRACSEFSYVTSAQPGDTAAPAMTDDADSPVVDIAAILQ